MADLSVEPRKLKFAEVHANYEKAKKDSSNRWGLYFIFGTLGIAVLVSAYFFLLPKTNDALAQNNVATEYSATQNNILSAGTSSEDKMIERSDSKLNSNNSTTQENRSEENSSLSDSNAKKENNDATSNEENSTANINAASLNKKETTTNISANQKKDAVVLKTDSKKENKISQSSTNSKNSNTTSNLTSKKVSNSDPNTNSTIKNSQSVKKDKPLNSSESMNISKLVPKTSVKKDQENAQIVKKDENQGANPIANTQPLDRSNVKNNSEGQDMPNGKAHIPSQETKDIAKNETSENNKGNTDKSSVAQQGSNDQNNNSNTNNTDPENKNEASTTEVREPDATTSKNKNIDSEGRDTSSYPDTTTTENHIPGVIGTGSVSPRNKHKWLIGAEVVYNTLLHNTKENSNAPSQFNTGDPTFSSAYANAVGKGKHLQINAAATIGYLYNEKIGVSSGISYFNLKHKFDIQTTSTPQYSTTIDHYVWSWVQDSSVSPPTLNLQITDTIYKQVITGNSGVSTLVNGDSAKTIDYSNKVRYISIPFNFSYNFRVGAKFSIEPQVGIVYAIPLRSQHLVATNSYEFNYTKTNYDLRRNLYFNGALKLGYSISNKMQLYVRGGYFFRNRSIYNIDQPISTSLKSIYTSFGISYRIK